MAAPTALLPDPVPVPGLGVSTDALPWQGRPVDAALTEAFAAAGLRLGPSDDVVTLSPGAVATREAIAAFVTASDPVEGTVVAGLPAPYAALAEDPVFGPPARLIRLRGGGAPTPARLEGATPVTLDVEGRPFQVPLLDVPGGREVTVHAATAVLLSRARWPGVLWADLLALGPRLLRDLPGQGLSRAARLLGAAVRAGSVDVEALGRALVRRGPGAWIHPDATVEGSVLGPDVRVDAGAVVRHSVLGTGAVVEPQGLVIGSVLGPGARVQRRGFVTHGVLADSAVVGGELQLGLLGPRAHLKIDGILLDQALGGPVRARIDGELREAPLGLLGAALGAEAMIGAGVRVAAGRVVPAGVQVVAGDSPILLRCGDEGPGRYRVDDGGLAPC